MSDNNGTVSLRVCMCVFSLGLREHKCGKHESTGPACGKGVCVWLNPFFQLKCSRLCVWALQRSNTTFSCLTGLISSPQRLAACVNGVNTDLTALIPSSATAAWSVWVCVCGVIEEQARLCVCWLVSLEFPTRYQGYGWYGKTICHNNFCLN